MHRKEKKDTFFIPHGNRKFAMLCVVEHAWYCTSDSISTTLFTNETLPLPFRVVTYAYSFKSNNELPERNTDFWRMQKWETLLYSIIFFLEHEQQK